MSSVSVVIPIYNHEAYIGLALESVVNQDHDNLEIVCVDDGSSDASAAVAQEHLERSGRPYQLAVQSNRGAHAALDRGASMANGELLMFLNSDDLYSGIRASRFADLWQRLERREEFWGFSCAFFIDDDGVPVDPWGLDVGHLWQYTEWARHAEWINELFSWHNLMLSSGNLVVTASLYRRTGGFASYQMVHDWDIALKLLAICSPFVIQDRLYGYRIHSSNTFRSISNDHAAEESRVVRDGFGATLLTRLRQEPYAHRGIPFVDYLRMRVPMKAGTTGR